MRRNRGGMHARTREKGNRHSPLLPETRLLQIQKKTIARRNRDHGKQHFALCHRKMRPFYTNILINGLLH
ncbi:hypothetical protein [Paraburkholderia oxyphila]|uniref:hypothetical protein n=1 Tax=Paraburkholderia oxyphila TaxID=614212 RepID=UPI001FDFACF8|nr:hypothetical protein [Paraburkholderia oxyphila]